MREIDIKPTWLHGTTTKFIGNGRKLGFPTANIICETDLRDGVYLALADLKDYKKHPSLVFIGKPTTKGVEASQRRVEAYLINIPDQDYYDLPIGLDLRHYLRPNEAFDTLEELTKQMIKDEEYAKSWFEVHH